MDVRTLLAEGLLDYVIPMVYGYNLCDPCMPFDWLLRAAAHSTNTSKAEVIPMVGPDLHSEDENRR